MTELAMEIRRHDGEFFPMLSLDRTRDALAAYCRNRWPMGRRKSVMREWSLTDDEARSVCDGRASWATFDKILNHKQGGWHVAKSVIGAMLGETIEQHLAREARKHAEHSRELLSLVSGRDHRADLHSGDSDGVGAEPDRRRGARGRSVG